MDGPAALEPVGEKELVERLRAGDDGAYELLVREHSGRMLAVARRILGNDDDAGDAVQEAFLSAFRSLDRFEGGSKLSTWLHRITVNASLMKLRRDRRKPMRAIEDLLPQFSDAGRRATWNRGVPTGDEVLRSEETRALVRRKIDELPDDYRIVLVLRDIEGLDTQQTATYLDITPAAVKTRLHRARQALRTLLAEELAS
jgi:RNA polymerase sigma-70 factor (ECF subfamily)